MNNINENLLIKTYPNRGIQFVRGEGVYLISDKGKKYLDLGSNYGVNIFGYGYSRIIKVLEKQLNNLIDLHCSFNNNVRDKAALELVNKSGGKLKKVFFSNSGAEAIEAALKFAKLAVGKSHFISMKNGYHGKTLGALSAGGGDKYRQPFLPLLWNFTHVPFGDLEAILRALNSKTGALIIEPVQGESGIKLAPKSYFQKLNDICKKHNILLIVDEIQTGIGRTGTFLASEQYGLQPDILCLGKGLAGGIPVGATLASEDIAQKIPMHSHTSTFGGNPLACSGILAVLREFEDKKVINHVVEMGKYFLDNLKKLKHKDILEVRGIGLMIGIELRVNATALLKKLQEESIIAIPAGSNIVRFLPPYLISKKEIDRVITALQKIFS